MSDWRLLALALAFVGWMAVDGRVSRKRLKLAALFILALAGSNAALPLLSAGFVGWRETPAETAVEVRREPSPAYRADVLHGDLPARTGAYQLFENAPAALLERNERILDVQTQGVEPGDDPVGYYLLREVRSEMSRRRIAW